MTVSLTVNDSLSEEGEEISVRPQTTENGDYVVVNGIITSIRPEEVTAITIEAGAFDNTIDLSRIDGSTFENLGPGSIEVYCGAGNDVVFGSSLADKIYGDEGDDQLFGGDGDDELHGGAGNDNPLRSSGGR